MSVRLWHLAVIGGAFGSLAAGSCAKFLRYGPHPAGEPFAIAFLAGVLLAGGPILLLAFRLPRRQRDDWPGIALLGRVVLAGTAAGAGGFMGAMAMATIVPPRWRIVPLFYALVALAAVGLVVAVGAVELFAISARRRAAR